jgi:heat shock protein HslJ
LLGRSIIVLITLGLLLPLMACGRSGERSDKPDEGSDGPETTVRAAPAEDLADLIGTEWVLVSLGGHDPVEGSVITLEFPNRGELDGEAGCDHYFSLYEIGGHDLHFTGRGLEVTDFECDKPQAVQEQASDYIELLRDVATIQAKHGRLELENAAGATTLTFVHPVPPPLDPALKGTEWVLVSLNGDAVTGGTRITLEIGKESLGGHSGCNLYGGGFEAMDDGTLKLSKGDEQMMGTTVGCSGERGRQERSYMEALHNAASYRLRGDRLEIRNAEGNTILAYEREPQWASDPADLVGTRWKLRSINGKSTPEDYTPAISFHSRSRYSG